MSAGSQDRAWPCLLNLGSKFASPAGSLSARTDQAIRFGSTMQRTPFEDDESLSRGEIDGTRCIAGRV